MTIAITIFVVAVVSFVAGAIFGRRVGAAALAKAEAELNLLKSL